MRGIAAVGLVVAMAAPVAGQAPPPGQAYYEFLMARRLEAQDDLTGALAALQRAVQLDPKSAELQAELAGYYARQDKATEAAEAAERALELDADNVEAHRILGLVNAAWADSITAAPAGRTPDALRARAIEHMSKVIGTPSAATDLNLQLTLARLYLRSKQADRALPLLESISSQAPFAAEPLTMLADAHLALGQMEQAVQALASAAEINPRFYAALADLYERQNQWADAAAAYGKAVGAGQGGAQGGGRDLRLRWASALLNVEGGATKARDIITEFLKTNPKDARGLYLLSTSQRAAGDLAGAEESARQLLALDPTNVPGLSALAQVLFERHDYRGVVDALSPFAADAAARARGREGEGAVLLARLGFAQRQIGDEAAAIGAFEAAQKMAPRNVMFDLYLLQAYVGAKQFDKASTMAAEALGRHPGDERLLRLQAQALSGEGKSADAVKLLRDALTAKPESRELAIGLAAVHTERREYEAAIGVLQQASAKAAEDEALTLQLASVFEEANRVPDAEREFRRLLQRDPLNATALNGLGYMLADRGQRLPEAVELIQRALTVDPDNPAYLDSLGWALFKQGKTAEAEPHLRRAAETMGGNSAIQDHFGDLLARQGRYQDAVGAWQRALDGDGTDIDRPALQKKIKDARARKP
jgi:tetratricopeptide (TPR) repeat protein